MSAYLEFSKKAFTRNMVYRVDYIIGVINTIIVVFIQVAIWKAIYGDASEINGIPFNFVVTNFILAICISTVFKVNDFALSDKVLQGTITNDLLKPININFYLMAETLGNNVFRLLMQFPPSLVISAIFLGLLPPHSFLHFILFFVSLMLGFLILYYISYNISVISFWFTNVWSISVIKTAVINILSGTVLPIWFMPDAVLNIMRFTPFDVIYFAPIKIYLGQTTFNDMGDIFLKQMIWVIVLFALSTLLWRKGIRRLCIAGG